MPTTHARTAPHDKAECLACDHGGHWECQAWGCSEPAQIQHRRHANEDETATVAAVRDAGGPDLTSRDGRYTTAVFSCDRHAPEASVDIHDARCQAPEPNGCACA